MIMHIFLPYIPLIKTTNCFLLFVLKKIIVFLFEPLFLFFPNNKNHNYGIDKKLLMISKSKKIQT